MENETKEIEARFKRLREYLEGPFVMAHEYPADDPEFEKRVVQLHGLVHELEAATTGGGKRITLELNNTITNDPCAICGARCDPDGFDFLIGMSLVCVECAKQKAPDLYLIHRDAHRWQENGNKDAWHDGAKAGAKSAGEKILRVIEESQVERVRRVCFEELGVEDEVPF